MIQFASVATASITNAGRQVRIRGFMFPHFQSTGIKRFALARELTPFDALTIDSIEQATAANDYRLKSILREVILSRSFRGEFRQ